MAASRTAAGRLETTTGLPSYTSAHTVMAWVNRKSSIASFYNVVLDYWTNTLGFSFTQFGVNGSTGTVRFRVYWSGTQITVTSAGNIGTNEWHHIAATKASGSGLTIYIDGVQDGTGTAPTDDRTGNSSWYVGEETGGSYDIAWKDVRWFEKEMVASEIVAEMRASEPKGTAFYSMPFYPGGDMTSWAKLRGCIGSNNGASFTAYGTSFSSHTFAGKQSGRVSPSPAIFISAAASQNILPGVITNTPTLYTSHLKKYAAVGAIAAGSSLYTPALRKLMDVGTIAASSSIYTPNVQRPLTVPHISSGASVYTPSQLSLRLDVGTRGTGVTVYTPALQKLMAMGTIASGSSVYTPQGVAYSGYLVVPQIAATTTLYSPRIQNAQGGTLGVRLGVRLGSRVT